MRRSVCRAVLTGMLVVLTGCATYPKDQETSAKEPPAPAYLKNFHPRVALVLGGGSARGFAHAGVIRALEANHIPIDLIVGTSAGSIVGALYAGHPSATALENTLLKADRDRVIDFSYWYLMSGPVRGRGLQTFINDNISATDFSRLPIPLMVVATDLATGSAHVFQSGPVAPAVNASSAMSPWFHPVTLYGRTYIDGGFVDPVPVRVAKQFHPKVIIAVSLNYKFDPSIPVNSPSTFLRGIYFTLSKLNDYSAAGADVVINPAFGHIDTFEDKHRDKIMRAGELAALNAMPQIRKLLGLPARGKQAETHRTGI